jgi:hypothetical protein
MAVVTFINFSHLIRSHFDSRLSGASSRIHWLSRSATAFEAIMVQKKPAASTAKASNAQAKAKVIKKPSGAQEANSGHRKIMRTYSEQRQEERSKLRHNPVSIGPKKWLKKRTNLIIPAHDIDHIILPMTNEALINSPLPNIYGESDQGRLLQRITKKKVKGGMVPIGVFKAVKIKGVGGVGQ